ncbi:hypothetical protein D3C81_666910 [compost metagenome]
MEGTGVMVTFPCQGTVKANKQWNRPAEDSSNTERGDRILGVDQIIMIHPKRCGTHLKCIPVTLDGHSLGASMKLRKRCTGQILANQGKNRVFGEPAILSCHIHGIGDEVCPHQVHFMPVSSQTICELIHVSAYSAHTC